MTMAATAISFGLENNAEALILSKISKICKESDQSCAEIEIKHWMEDHKG